MSESVPQLAAPPAQKRKSKRLQVIISLLLTLIVLFFVSKSLLACFRDIRRQNIPMTPHTLPLLGCLACLMVHRLISGQLLESFLKTFGSSIGTRRACAVIWTSSLGRYLPGKVAAVSSAVLMLVKLGARLPAAVAALTMSTAVTIVTATMMASPVLFSPELKKSLPHGHLLALLIILLGFASLHPRLFAGLCNLALRKMNKPPLPAGLSMLPFITGVLLTVTRSVIMGLATWFALRSLTSIAGKDFLYILATTMLSTVAGFLAVFAPAGIGISEGVYLVALAPTYGPQVALAALYLRLVRTASDILSGAAGGYMVATDTRMGPVSNAIINPESPPPALLNPEP